MIVILKKRVKLTKKKLIVLIMSAVMLVCILPREGEAVMTDREFFQVVDLNYSGLEKVRKAVNNEDYEKAKIEFINHIKTRKKPVYFPLDVHADKDTIRKANKILNHTFTFQNRTATLGKDIKWNENTVGDQQWPIALNRHGYWLTLGKAYRETKNKKYAKEFVAQLLGWVRKMPVRITGNCVWLEGTSDDVNISLNVGIRAGSSWIPAFYYFQNAPSFTTNAQITMFKSLWDHAYYLANPERFHVNSNWGTHEADGLFTIAIMFPEFKKSSEWMKLAWQRFDEMIEKQVYPDGFQKELTTHYHCVALRHFEKIVLLSKLNEIKVPRKYMNKLEKMYECLMCFVKPDGTAPMINDSDVGPGRRGLKRGIELFKRSDFAYVYSGGKEGTVPKKKSIGFPYAGVYITRSGWGENALYLAFDCGPSGTTGHRHRDHLNIDIYAYGRSLIVDPGRYIYVANKWRDFFRDSSRAHNTIIVDNSEQNWWQQETKEPLRNNWLSTVGFDYVEGVHKTGYETAKNVIHKRKVLFIKDEYWLISDLIEGSGKHQIDQFWHFTPGPVRVDNKTKNVQTVKKHSANIIVSPIDLKNISLKIVEGQENPVQGWYSPEYGFKEPAPVAIYTKKTVELPTKLDTILYPYPTGHNPEISVQRLPVMKNGKKLSLAQTSGLEIKIDKKVDYILISHDEYGMKKFGQFMSNGELTYIRKDTSGDILRVLIKDGSTLYTDNVEIFNSNIILSNMEIKYESKTLKINASHIGRLKVYAPGIDKVLLNDKEIEFTRDGNYIILTGEGIWLSLKIEGNSFISGESNEAEVTINNYSTHPLKDKISLNLPDNWQAIPAIQKVIASVTMVTMCNNGVTMV